MNYFSRKFAGNRISKFCTDTVPHLNWDKTKGGIHLIRIGKSLLCLQPFLDASKFFKGCQVKESPKNGLSKSILEMRPDFWRIKWTQPLSYNIGTGQVVAV